MEVEVLASPEMTGEWEYKLNQILKGELTRDAFMAEVRAPTSSITDKIKNFKSSDKSREAAFSPVDGIRFFETPTAYESEDGKLTIRKILGAGLCRTRT